MDLQQIVFANKNKAGMRIGVMDQGSPASDGLPMAIVSDLNMIDGDTFR